MKKETKMPIRDNREYRNIPLFNIEKRAEGAEPNYIVEGYASTFEPYVLFTDGETEYKEQILPEAFDGCNMDDVIFCKDHEGTVFARTRNHTLQLTVDEKGLHTRTDLSKTTSAKQMYEEIEAGMYDQMSFAFVVDDDEYDQRSHTRIIRHIKKLFDVSAVSFPANPDTDISTVSARNSFNGFIEAEKAERLEEQRRLELEKDKLLLLIEMEKENYNG